MISSKLAVQFWNVLSVLKNGAEKVSAYVTHPVFPNESYKKFFPDNETGKSLLETFFITNTIPTVAKTLQSKKPFKVLSISSVLCHSLLDDQLGYKFSQTAMEMDCYKKRRK